MEFRNILTFLRAAELHSFTRAAEEMGYAQSTVTFHIQQLEAEIGVSLFDRIGKKVSLTPAGEQLVTYANQRLQLEYQVRQIKGSVENLPGTLRIGTVESLLTTYVTKQLPVFHQRFSNITLEVTTASSSELLQMLRNNDLDLIFIFSKQIVDPDLVRLYSKRDQLFFVTSSHNPLAKKEDVTFQDISCSTLILPERISIYRQAAEEVASQFNCMFSPAIQIDNTAIIMQLLKEGLGISFLPRYLIQAQLDSRELATLHMEKYDLQPYCIQILCHKRKYVTPQMRAFSELMELSFQW